MEIEREEWQDLMSDVRATRDDVIALKVYIEALPDHEKRIRRLERWMYGIPVSLLAALVGFVHHS